MKELNSNVNASVITIRIYQSIRKIMYLKREGKITVFPFQKLYFNNQNHAKQDLK